MVPYGTGGIASAMAQAKAAAGDTTGPSAADLERLFRPLHQAIAGAPAQN